MGSSNSERDFLSYALIYCNRLESALINYNIGSKNELIKKMYEDYVFCAFIVQYMSSIAEYSSRYPEDFKSKSAINWRSFSRLRNVPSHDYEAVRYEVIANALYKNIPQLQREIIEYKRNIEKN